MSDGVFYPLCKTYHPEADPCPRFATAHPRHQSTLVHPLNQVTFPPRHAPDAPAAAAAALARTRKRAATEQPAARRSIRVRKALAKGKPTIWHYPGIGEDGQIERKTTQDYVLANAHRRFRRRKGKGVQGGEEGEGQEEQAEEQEQGQQQQEQQQEQ